MSGVLMFRLRRMPRTGAQSNASETSLHTQSSADYITGTHESSFWKRQQEELAESMRTIELRHFIDDELTEDDWKIINRRVKRRQLASDDEVRALFDQYRS